MLANDVALGPEACFKFYKSCKPTFPLLTPSKNRGEKVHLIVRQGVLTVKLHEVNEGPRRGLQAAKSEYDFRSKCFSFHGGISATKSLKN